MSNLMRYSDAAVRRPAGAAQAAHPAGTPYLRPWRSLHKAAERPLYLHRPPANRSRGVPEHGATLTLGRGISAAIHWSAVGRTHTTQIRRAILIKPPAVRMRRSDLHRSPSVHTCQPTLSEHHQ